LESETNHPDEIAGYSILESLAPASFLALAPGNRQVVLKLLDPDCLVVRPGGVKLHPSIRDRLARVRELAHARVANLHGVERDPNYGDETTAFLVWEHVPGRTLDDWATSPEVTPKELLLIARELILTVESLHARGIVHGSLHGRNILITPEAKLKLTHLSPLLYTEPEHDLACIAELFRGISTQRNEEDSPLELLAEEADESDGSLRSMGSRAASLIDLKKDEASEQLERAMDRRRRRRSRLAAGIVVAIALLLSYGIKHYVNALTPKPPAPPVAAEP
jgi:serine/threonine protein kinase